MLSFGVGFGLGPIVNIKGESEMDIKMVDLNGQYLKIKNEIDAGIQEVIDSSAFINGPKVSQFISELSAYLKCKYVIPCANGTDALQIALMALGLKPGDEIIIPDFTFIATAEVAALLRLRPIFVDVNPDTFLMDISQFKKAITQKTKAVIPVHLYGQCANMEEIMEVATEHGIFVIEDTAQAIGADVLINNKWQKAGTIGDIGCTSFFPSKNLGCYGDGGAIFTNDEELGKDLAAITNHGAKKKYYNDMVGVNSRLDSIQAAILSVKLKELDNYSIHRNKAADLYDKLLHEVDEVKIPQRIENSTHVFHQYTLVVKRRDELKEFLAGRNIPAMIYYPVGMHNQKPYKCSGDFNNSDMLCKCVLSLPMHTELTEKEQVYIADTIKEFYRN